MTYSFPPGAELDIDKACGRYRTTASGSVVARFLDEIDRIARLLVREPGLGTRAGVERSSFPIHGFPYTIIYKPTDVGIRVLVVRHQHRDPEHDEGRR